MGDGLEAERIWTTFFAVATDSFQTHLDRIEKQGRRNSPDWHLVNAFFVWHEYYSKIMRVTKSAENRLHSRYGSRISTVYD